MKFQALEISLEVIRHSRKAYTRMKVNDPDLARQFRKALSSLPLNLSEGARRVGKDKKYLWCVAAGSGAEARTCLRVAEAWGDTSQKEVAKSLGLLDRVLAMTWKLTN